MNALVISPPNAKQVRSLPAADLDRAVEFARAEKAASTRKAYGSDFSIFRDWCLPRGVSALPASPETVAAFLAYEAESGLRPSTVTRPALPSSMHTSSPTSNRQPTPKS